MEKSISGTERHTLTQTIFDLASDLGAVVVGIAPVDRFHAENSHGLGSGSSYTATGYAAEDLLPGARSVLVVAVRIPHGVFASSLTPLETTYVFGNFGYVHLNRLLNHITYNVACHLEDQGWTSLPIGACGASRCDLQSYEEGLTISPLHGIFNLKRAAVLSGVGRRTRSGLIATSLHGTRVRLGAVITAADLVASPMIEGTPCPSQCRICVESCPMNAINVEGHVNHVACFSDNGRRGTTESEILSEMSRAFPIIDTQSGYLAHEHAAIDGSGNRVCRAACMAACPLWKVG